MLFQYVDSEWTVWRGNAIFTWTCSPCWNLTPLADAVEDFWWAKNEEQYERLVRSGGTLPYAFDGLEFA